MEARPWRALLLHPAGRCGWYTDGMKSVLPWWLVVVILLLTGDGARGAEDEGDAVEVAAYYYPAWHRRHGDIDLPPGEWKQLQSARPKFPGHLQPKVPVWGYEEETDPKAMARKIDAAADHGVSILLFDWYHNDWGPYLEAALNEGFLKAPNHRRVKFALMWANHNLGPSPGEVDRKAFDRIADHIVKDYFVQPGYWKIDGRCYFSIYEVQTLIKGLGGVEQTRAALDDLDRKARAAGLAGVHLNIVDWQLKDMPAPADTARALGARSVTSYVWVHHVPLVNAPTEEYGRIEQAYLAMWDRQRDAYGVPYMPNVMMGWDPTPRMRPGEVFDGKSYPGTPVVVGNTPQRFGQALRSAVDRAKTLPLGHRVVTVYAWNEWTEGGYLEPDERNGMAYLEEVKKAVGR